ncbi:sulfotransferase domain-containing protein [Pelagibius marinus]|uniref:sulfotransferase domain-containing protein n=1 Tax=Pelagibius marinus TaxID=2762760 RepID=UPI001872CF4A|nr:sulfotransferase domain-containing protein [Pelagibius marinus]
MPGILWLASYPKSGNTWMRAFLANLILDAPEPLPLKHIGEACPSEPSEIWFEPFADKPVAELTAKEIAPLRTRAQERVVSLNKNVVPMKTHSYLGEDFGYPIFSMKATYGAVYIIRDPRDVAVSAADHFGKTLDEMIAYMDDALATCAPMAGQIVHELQSSWSNHVESWTKWNHPRIFVVRYEDLLVDPLDQFGRIAERFGISKDRARIEKAVEFSSFKQLQQLEEDQGFVERSIHSERFFRSGRSGGWQEKLTPAQARKIESDHAVQMKRFGYL